MRYDRSLVKGLFYWDWWSEEGAWGWALYDDGHYTSLTVEQTGPQIFTLFELENVLGEFSAEAGAKSAAEDYFRLKGRPVFDNPALDNDHMELDFLKYM